MTTGSLTLRELDGRINWLAAKLGCDWLESELARGYQRAHPLARWIGLAKTALPENRLVTSESFRVARLARCLSSLEKSKTESLDLKIREMKSGNTEKFHGTHQEIITAAKYADLGYAVEFILESYEKSPDLLIDGRVEVECKTKAFMSPADKARRDLYDLLSRRASEAIERPNTKKELEIQVRFRQEPTRDNIEVLIKVIAEVAAIRGPRSISCSHGDFPHRVRGFVEARRPNPYVTVFQKVDIKLGCDIAADGVKSLRSSLKSATRQFSGTRPSVIHVDISDVLQDLIEDDNISRVRDLLQVFLRNNTSISAVVLEHDHFTREDGYLRPSRRVEAIWNYNARMPVGEVLGAQLDVLDVPF